MQRLPLLVCIIILLSLLFSASCVSKEVPMTETYFETEYRQEAYIETAQVEVSRTPQSVKIAGNWPEGELLPAGSSCLVFKFYPGPYNLLVDREPLYNSIFIKNPLTVWTYNWDEPVVQKPDISALAEYPEFVQLYNTMTTASSYSPTSLRYANTVFVGSRGDSRNCRVVVEWNSICKRPIDPDKLDVLFTSDAKQVYIGSGHDMQQTRWWHDIVNTSVAFKSDSSGTIEFNLSDAEAKGNLSDRYMIIFFQTSRNTCFQVQVFYKWDDIKTETRQVTKYRTVPVQVQKQRKVIQTK